MTLWLAAGSVSAKVQKGTYTDIPT